jgi:type IV pilus assembly protein PilA
MVERRGRARRRGVTLIEVMVVTAIIGVLAVLAGAGYSRWIRSAKTAEATNMLAGIRNGQENYLSQTGTYLNVSSNLSPPSFYPLGDPKGNAKTSWNSPVGSTTTAAQWLRIGVKPDGPVYFGYAVVADAETCDPSCRGLNFYLSTGVPINWTAENGGSIAKPWFVAAAQLDSDNDGRVARVVGMSFSSRIVVDNEGE